MAERRYRALPAADASPFLSLSASPRPHPRDTHAIITTIASLHPGVPSLPARPDPAAQPAHTQTPRSRLPGAPPPTRRLRWAPCAARSPPRPRPLPRRRGRRRYLRNCSGRAAAAPATLSAASSPPRAAILPRPAPSGRPLRPGGGERQNGGRRAAGGGR